MVQDASLAYFTLRRREVEEDGIPRSRLGAIGHGPAGSDLAHRICEQIEAWDRDRAARPVITAYPTDIPDGPPHDVTTIKKRHIRLAVVF